MSFVVTTPELMTGAATDVAAIGSAVDDARAAAAAQTTSLAPAAADEVSAAITAVFNAHGADFQTLQAQATVFHQRFIDLMNGGAAQYLRAESQNAQRIVNGSLLVGTGRPLFGDGASGFTNAHGVGVDGGSGGWLWGNGGNGGNSTAPGLRGGNGGDGGFLWGSGGNGGRGADALGGSINSITGGTGGNGGYAELFGNGGNGGDGGTGKPLSGGVVTIAGYGIGGRGGLISGISGVNGAWGAVDSPY